ncbi:septal ring factor EnvC (AmiA/AmiB activator) [Rhodothalassium salexigens DSM 2132]|uniref:Septal ring factor EnvC (AmiA/AmiB activator) n=1 Tax=Rhodothalassium salexigens DSM 2132 TaxID=1188247 RepID=A0A4R2PLI3_RHOSA|nr:peptidoglycan DD-metalloendopeptidase family protein [Rhodothalassium salexigens]MBB4210870.1 septal ring factor EnvC (AmiA/AmiB activator) [Rhodothalassium salexigens DSM 2132]MBK1639159.1 hypothetical protein [Rhodothalassium salexigens DSM 2132]TCP36472.1 septal ring factor EnvC (AmiA/AmiB activator) [Rhodothalassium salexigens DSM 2132]
MTGRAAHSTTAGPRPRAPGRLVAALGLAIALSLASAPAHAQQEERARLDRIEAELATRAAEQRKLAEQAQAAGAEAEALTRRLSAVAAEIQSSEARADSLERDIRVVTRRQNDKRAELAERREQMSRTLAALQRLSRQPPALAVLRPGGALDVARGGTLLATLVPQVEARAAAIADDIEDLRTMRARLARDRAALDSTLARLDDRRERLAALLDRRERDRRRLQSELAQEKKKIASLARQAESLEALIDKLEAEQAERQRLLSEALARAGESRPERGKSARDERRLAGLPKAAGDLPLPAQGAIIQAFGAPKELGKTEGVTIRTRAGAQVVAPYDGRILFAGPYKGYGRLLIIDHGEDYLSILAGLDRLYCQEMQWVLAGEPVGAMAAPARTGSAPSSRVAADRAAGTQGPGPTGGTDLYMELRRAGKPVDPLPWLAASIEQMG